MAQLQTNCLRMESWTAELTLAAIYDRSKLGHLLGVSVLDDFPNQPVREYVLPKLVAKLQDDPSLGRWSGMIIHKADEMVIGSMGAKALPDAEGMIEIGYDIVPAYQGNGYATEMAKAFVLWAFAQPGVTRITAECLPDNLASIRVLEKVGMRRVDSSVDMLRWELRV